MPKYRIVIEVEGVDSEMGPPDEWDWQDIWDDGVNHTRDTITYISHELILPKEPTALGSVYENQRNEVYVRLTANPGIPFPWIEADKALYQEDVALTSWAQIQ